MAKVLGFTINIQGTDAAIENATDLKLAIREINKQLKETTDASEYEQLERELIRLKASQREVNAQIRQSIKDRQAELDVAEDSVGAYRRLASQLSAARNRYKDLAAAGKENTDEARALVVEVTRLDERLKGIDADVGQFQRNVGNYENAIRNALPALSQFQEGIQNIREQGSLTAKALATGFLALEIGSFLLDGIRQIKAFADEFINFRREVNRQTGLLGDDLGEATASAVAIAETYNQETQEVIRAANTVAREFDVSINEALDRTAVAFREGANNSNELLDSLREYSGQVDDIDALFNILIRAGQEGIYSDKGIDAVKEFNLRVLEQTDATRTALENAFGQEFTNQLFDNINSGAITTTEALGQVATGLRDVDLTAAEAQGVIANVFGGPGEDAGRRFIELLADVDEGLITATDSTDSYRQQQEELFQVNLEVARAQDELAAALEGSSAEFDILVGQIKTFLFDQATRFVEFFESLGPAVAGFQAAIEALKNNVSAGFGLFGETERVGRAFTDAYKEARREVKATNEEIREQQEEQRKARKEARKSREEARAALEAQRRNRRATSFSRRGPDRGSAVGASPEQVEENNRRILEAERRAELQRLSLVTTLGQRTAQAIGNVENEKTRGVLDAIQDRSNQVRTALQQQQDFEQETLRQGVEQLGNTLLNQGFEVLQAFGQAAAEERTQRLDEQIAASEESIARLEARAAQAGRVERERLQEQIQRERAVLNQRVEAREEAQRELARREKAISITQSVIQTALAVVRALAAPPGPPFTIPQAVAAGAFGAAQTAVIAAQPLATGGVVGTTVRGEPIVPLQNGDSILATLTPGEVVLNADQQALLGGPRTFQAIGVPGFQAGGRVPSNMAPRIPREARRKNDLEKKLEDFAQAALGAIEATNNRIDRLRAVVVSEDVAEDLSEGETLRINATLQ